MIDSIVQIVGGFVVGGGLVGVLTAWFNFRAKKLDNSAEERKEMKEELRLLRNSLNQLQQQYNKMHAEFTMQESEIVHLRNQVDSLKIYKNQTKLIGRCRAALNDYFKTADSSILIDKLTKELMN